MATKREQILKSVIEFLNDKPKGEAYSSILSHLKTQYPSWPVNTLHGGLTYIRVNPQSEIYRPSEGVYVHNKYKPDSAGEVVKETKEVKDVRIKEETFYRPFADWLEGFGETTRSITLGGNRFKSKWGTPDVIGKKESKKSDILQAQTEIISAEIKIDDGLALITAFGQACAYKLFSHKVYMVIPKDSNGDDIERLDALSKIFGIGLILFDSTNVDIPDFQIRTRAIKHEPDMDYVNENLKIIEDELFN